MKNKKRNIFSRVMTRRNACVAGVVGSLSVAGLFVFANVSMAGWNGLVQFFGRVSGSSDVSQSVLLDGRVYGVNADWNIKVDGIAGGETVWNGPHSLENKASVPVKVTIETDPGASGAVERVWHNIQTVSGFKAESPSFVKGSDGAYWLFFSGGRCGVSDAGCAADRGVFYSVSMDKGVSWSHPSELKAGGTPSGYGDVSAVSVSGEMFVFVSKGDSAAAVSFTRSSSNGASWSDWSSVPGVSGKKISSVSSGGSVILVYQGENGVFDISSSNKGSSWSAPVMIDPRGGSPDAVIGADGVMRVVWDDEGKGIYMSYSGKDRFVSGSVWKSLAGPVVETPDLTDGDPSVFLDGSGKYWLSYSSGDGTTEAVRYATSDDGFYWSAPRILMERSGMKSGSPEVCETGDGGVTVFFSSDNGTGSAAGERNIWMSRSGKFSEVGAPMTVSLPAGSKIGVDVSNVFSDRTGESVYSVSTKVR